MELIGVTPRGLKFLYKTRRDPKIDKYLTGNPPLSYEDHMVFMASNSHRFRILVDKYSYVGYGQITEREDGHCEVGFVVATEYQNMGYGKRLIDLIVTEAEIKYKTLGLYVKKNNEWAIRICKRIGFKECRLINNDEWYMEKEVGI